MAGAASRASPGALDSRGTRRRLSTRQRAAAAISHATRVKHQSTSALVVHSGFPKESSAAATAPPAAPAISSQASAPKTRRRSCAPLQRDSGPMAVRTQRLTNRQQRPSSSSVPSITSRPFKSLAPKACTMTEGSSTASSAPPTTTRAWPPRHQAKARMGKAAPSPAAAVQSGASRPTATKAHTSSGTRTKAAVSRASLPRMRAHISQTKEPTKATAQTNPSSISPGR